MDAQATAHDARRRDRLFDGIADQAHPVSCIVLLDNASIHRGEAMEQKRRQWRRRGLYLYYLPPYSPELNRIEILWKQAKYFWHKFTRGSLFGRPQQVMPNLAVKTVVNLSCLKPSALQLYVVQPVHERGSLLRSMRCVWKQARG